MSDDTFTVKLECFEGPMDLLCHLVHKNKVDIHNIPIAVITDQYIKFIEFLKEIHIDISGDFLVMASTLTQIKSKNLLPVHTEPDEVIENKIGKERPIDEYMKLKIIAQQLAERYKLEEDIFNRAPEADIDLSDEPDKIIEMDVVDLISAFQNLLRSMPDQTMNLTRAGISVKDRISQIIDLLEEKNKITFLEFFVNAPSKADMVITFLALLEMVKLNIITIVQHVETGVIDVIYL